MMCPHSGLIAGRWKRLRATLAQMPRAAPALLSMTRMYTICRSDSSLIVVCGLQAQQRCADVNVWFGDALKQIPSQFKGRPPIDMLFLDGTPSETLQYLKAAEPFLAEGATVVADNAGVFANGGMKPYLEYVRSDSRYSSKLVKCKLEWRDDVEDGIEVSQYWGQNSSRQLERQELQAVPEVGGA